MVNFSKSMLDGERTVTSWPRPTKSLTAAGTVPSPSQDEMMNTGDPLLNLPDTELVTACSGILPLLVAPASALKILKYCLSPVSGGR